MKRIVLLVTTSFVFVLACSLAAHDGHDEDVTRDDVFRIGKGGEVKFGGDVRVGDTLVKKGKYVIAHRIDGDSHVLTLEPFGPKTPSAAFVYEIRTRWFPSQDPVKASAIVAEQLRDRSFRVKTVQIAGEARDHVPERGRVRRNEIPDNTRRTPAAEVKTYR